MSRLLLAALLLAPATVFAIPAAEVPKADVDDVLVDDAFDKFEDAKKVAFAGFQVAFITRNKVTAVAEDWIRGGSGSKATMEVLLGGVSYAQMQEIADEAYKVYVEKVKAAGLEVIPEETVKAAAAYKTFEFSPGSASAPALATMGNIHFVTVPASTLPLWYTNWDPYGKSVKDGNASKANLKATAALSKELGGALVLQPRIALDFSILTGSGKKKLTGRSEVAAQNKIAVAPQGTQFYIFDDNLHFISMKDAIGYECTIGEFVGIEEANNQMMVEAFGNLGINIGAVDTKKTMVMKADPAAFKKEMLSVIGVLADLYQRGIKEAKD